MKIMFLYPNHVGYFRCPVGLTLIMTVCKNAGHDVKLFDTTFMNVSENKDQETREKSGQVKPMLLQTEKLTKNFGGLTAISDLDFAVAEGEIRGLIGPN